MNLTPSKHSALSLVATSGFELGPLVTWRASRAYSTKIADSMYNDISNTNETSSINSKWRYASCVHSLRWRISNNQSHCGQVWVSRVSELSRIKPGALAWPGAVPADWGGSSFCIFTLFGKDFLKKGEMDKVEYRNYSVRLCSVFDFSFLSKVRNCAISFVVVAPGIIASSPGIGYPTPISFIPIHYQSPYKSHSQKLDN